MTPKEAAMRIKKHNEIHVKKEYPFAVFITEALNMAVAMLESGLTPERCKELAKAEQEGRLVELPCAYYQTIYRICKCEDIPKQLDGTLYSPDGSHGTATGYYCPYEDNCPQEAEHCDRHKQDFGIFEDELMYCYIDATDEWCHFKNTPAAAFSEFGKTVFLTYEEAEKALESEEHIG